MDAFTVIKIILFLVLIAFSVDSLANSISTSITMTIVDPITNQHIKPEITWSKIVGFFCTLILIISCIVMFIDTVDNKSEGKYERVNIPLYRKL